MTLNQEDQVLTDAQRQEFLENGVLVVDNFLTQEEVKLAFEGFSRTLARFGVDMDDLEGTGHHIQSLSSTNGSGGVLDIFYDEWRMKVASHPRLFRATCELWKSAYCHNGERLEDISPDESFKWHPYGAFDYTKGFMYIDRVGYRLPSALAENLGSKLEEPHATHVTATSMKKRKRRAIQRSLTPHLDCCPETVFSKSNSKWRPVQCFVSLTSNLEPNTGGFEAAPRFHREFQEWSSHRPPSSYFKTINGVKQESFLPPACIGEYTHIRPKEDKAVMERVQHVPVAAGSVVFWDNRIPHANAYRNDSNVARAVIYCSFLPDVALNRRYLEIQLENFRKRVNPSDQWIKANATEDAGALNVDFPDEMELSMLGRKLLGIDQW